VLVWHNQLPAWLNEGTFTNDELRAILRRHVKQVARHYSGHVRAWDVVNEPFNEDGTWRDTLWSRAMGPGYIAKALRWAHRADPRAKLFLNDYNLEALGPKSDAMYRLVADLKRRGVPIHGVGFQGHLSLEYPFPERLTENLRRFAALGVDVAFTEVDVRIPLPVTEEKLALQADYYERTMRSCRAVRRCRTYTVWGFTDAHSWVPEWFPGEGAATLFDEEYRPKPAYFAVRRARG
jgi:endo-1,4-beta-xylanase